MTRAVGLHPADIGPFLARLIRLDPAAVVRLRPAGAAVRLWGRLPWEVLVSRTAAGAVDDDLAVSAGDLLEWLAASRADPPRRRDADWRWGLPPSAGEAVETVPAADVLRLGAAAARTLRESRGRVGERVLRDALLEHVAITVRDAGVAEPVEVRQSLVQAVLRMGFVTTGQSEAITVRVAGRWVGLATERGEVWQQKRSKLAIRIVQ